MRKGESRDSRLAILIGLAVRDYQRCVTNLGESSHMAREHAGTAYGLAIGYFVIDDDVDAYGNGRALLHWLGIPTTAI